MGKPYIIRGFEGLETPGWLCRYMGNGVAAGVILFRRNYESLDQLVKLAGSIRDSSDTPPLVMVDQEGGRVQRFRAPFTEWPYMRELGATGDVQLARRFGRAVATEMLAVGVNTILAPVLCLDTQPGDT